MIFTAGTLKGDGLTVAEVKGFQVAPKRQMQFWIVLLSLDLLAVVMLIAGKAADWRWNSVSRPGSPARYFSTKN